MTMIWYYQMAKLSDYINYDGNPKQKEAYKLLGSGGYIFYGGARGGGKSFLSLSGALSCCIQFAGLKVVILRRYYGELQELFIDKLTELFPSDVFGYKYRDKTKTATFNNGSKIIFRAAERAADANKVKGLEYQLMIIDEANEFDEFTIQKLIGSLRKTNIESLRNFQPTLLMTGNPGGISDMWFDTHFIEPDYKYWKSYELTYKDKYTFIPAKVYDNPHIDQVDYIAKLNALDPDLRDAWLNGNWKVFEGQFFKEWSEDIHVIKPFDIPEDWDRVRGIDIGWTKRHPTVCLWAAQDPQTLEVYIYKEYVSMVFNTEQYAIDIEDMSEGEYISRTFADPSMFDESKKKQASDESDAFIFLKSGVPLMKANNGRVIGWRVLKAWLHHTEKRPPRLKIFEDCRQLIKTIPTLRYEENRIRNGEDLDTLGQDDAVDALRYIMMSAFGYPTEDMIRDNVETYKLEKPEEFYKETNEKILNDFMNYGGWDNVRYEEEVKEKSFRERTYVSPASSFV